MLTLKQAVAIQYEDNDNESFPLVPKTNIDVTQDLSTQCIITLSSN